MLQLNEPLPEIVVFFSQYLPLHRLTCVISLHDVVECCNCKTCGQQYGVLSSRLRRALMKMWPSKLTEAADAVMWRCC